MLLESPAEIRAFYRRDPELHVYELGDLDPFFWPRTQFFALDPDRAIALLYDAPTGPVLAALAREPDLPAMRALLVALRPTLPPALYAHLSPGLVDALAPRFTISHHHGRHLKMALRELKLPALKLPALDQAPVELLGPSHAGELAAFYARAYPGNWFDPRMLDAHEFTATHDGDHLTAVAGLHVYSRAERVAALGSIATDPAYRGRGLAALVTGVLCARLRHSVDVIGLNVKADNTSAIRVYERLGFVRVADFDELALAG